MVDFISKSKIIFFVLLFFTVVFTSWHMLRTDVSADPLYDSSQVVITTQIGYGNRLILNKCIPVFVTVDNRTEDTIKGELCISFSGDVGYSAYSGGPSQNEYRTDVTIPPNVKKTMTVSVYQNSYRNSIDSSVIDKNGNVLCSSVNFLKYTNLNYRGNDFPVLVGVLTDDPDQLRYLSNLENSPVNAVGYNDSQYYVEYLNTDSFPTNKTEISSFDFIIVNDFDISSSSSLYKKKK
ncbi:MAG: hypothetical protein LBI03_09550, partial [Clostridiales bacterium]|nr:hypothetical protein [Clostridiales bacterium]